MIRLMSLVVLLLACTLTPAQEVTLKRVTYEELQHAITAHRGKVVVVDFWASFCTPCRKAFPHLMKLHRDYEKYGLVVITVSVDDTKDPDAVAEALRFLKQQKATTVNVLLQDGANVLEKKLKIESIPATFVFNRAGQIEKKYTDAPAANELDRLVTALLRQKGSR
jgi:thiol-disulfide isomerase/thioredoxin